MRILFLSRAFPTNPETQSSGLFGRFRTLLKGAASTGADIKILFFVDDPYVVLPDTYQAWEQRLSKFFEVNVSFALCPLEADDPKSRNSLWGLLKGAVAMRYQSVYLRTDSPTQVSALERELDHGVDLLFVHRLSCMPPLLRLAKSRQLPRLFLDLDDIEHIAFFRSIGQKPVWMMKRLQYLQVPALIMGEAAAIKLAERVFVCSQTDVEKLRKLAGGQGITALPNTVKVPLFTLPAAGQVLLFLGTFEYEPNLRAVEFFLDQVWPLIRKQVPEAKFLVGGNRAERVRQFCNPPAGVEFAGYIPHLADAYKMARAVVCPILSGGGTRVKLVEAAAYGRPMVSTTVGAEGLDFEANTEILIGDSATKFAENCVQLLNSDQLARSIGKQAHLKACQFYDQSAIVEKLRDWILRKIKA